MSNINIRIDPAFKPSPGLIDQTAVRLEAIGDALAAAPEDQWSKTVIKSATLATKGLIALRQFTWRPRDKLEVMVQANEGMLAATTRAIAQAAGGARGTLDHETGVRGQQAHARNLVFKSAVEEVTNDVRDRAAQVSTSALEALKEFERAIRKAKVLATLPRGSADLSRVATIEPQIRARPLPAKFVHDTWSELIESGATDEATVFADAAKAIMVELRDSPAGVTATRYQFAPRDEVQNERDLAWRWLRAVHKYESDLIAESSIDVAEKAFNELRELFAYFTGTDVRHLTRPQRQSLYAVNASPRAKWDADFHPDFAVRFLVKPPDGWSRVSGTTKQGTLIRESPRG